VTDKRLLVAIVDDDESVRRALARLIQSADMDAVLFGCGEKFLGECERLKPDCVVLDLHMPGTSGFEVQVRLQAFPTPPPVVAITGCDTLEAAARIMGSGATAYLLKPVEKQTLLEAIARAAGGQK
jgi:FixJ family two-component response regulator